MAVPDLQISGDNFNSYGTLGQGNKYFEARFDAEEWNGDSVEEDDQKTAMIMATQRMEMEEYEGSPTDTNQKGSFPRTGLQDRDGRAYASDVTPDPVLHSQFEIALVILKNREWFRDRGTEGWVEIQGVGRPNNDWRAMELPEIVKMKLATILKQPASILGVY